MTATPTGAVDFGDGFAPEPKASFHTSLVLASYDGTGALRFGKMFGFDTDGVGYFSLAQDSAGNFIVAGDATGAMDFGGGPVGDPTQRLTTVAAFDTSGHHLWSKALDAEAGLGTGLAIDPFGHIWVSTASNSIVELDAGGAVKATHPLDGSGQRHAAALGFRPGGVPIIAGVFDGTLDLGQGLLTPQSKQDVFVAALTP